MLSPSWMTSWWTLRTRNTWLPLLVSGTGVDSVTPLSCSPAVARGDDHPWLTPPDPWEPWAVSLERSINPFSKGPHAESEQMSNGSSITEFLFLAFTDRWELQLWHFGLFLGISLAALLGNGLIITAIACDHHLHTPMYFFLLNLSLLHLGSISTTLPKVMASSLWGISYHRCAVQVFLFLFFFGAEYSLFSLMSYNCYIAICKPLHYGTLLGSRACVHMAAAAWGTELLRSLLHTANTLSQPLCQGNILDQFF
ncbi:olfactory receptor 14I1-like [Athene noctua]|uniref:olfactory receptor 14I1-like n=1 Tax=Athene noctua TaxID=126797 RepID=UPI003EC0CCB7